jgi:hypothetical protein
MFVPAMIDSNREPYTKRAPWRGSERFPERKGGSVRSAARVVPQFNECQGKENGTRCGNRPGMVCCSGICTFGPC